MSSPAPDVAHRGRILVVDDDASLAEMLTIVLRQEGFDGRVVTRGDLAMEAFHDYRPDVVLLEEVWGYRHAADTRLVNVHVQRLRSKVEHDPENPEVVVTVRGVGYKAGSS